MKCAEMRSANICAFLFNLLVAIWLALDDNSVHNLKLDPKFLLLLILNKICFSHPIPIHHCDLPSVHNKNLVHNSDNRTNIKPFRRAAISCVHCNRLVLFYGYTVLSPICQCMRWIVSLLIIIVVDSVSMSEWFKMVNRKKQVSNRNNFKIKK